MALISPAAPGSEPPSSEEAPRPGRHQQRPDLAQVVIDDRLAAVEPQRRDQLPDPLSAHRRLVAKQPMDLRLERIELRAHRPAPIAGRRRRAQRRPNRVARQPRPPRQLLDRHPPTKCSRRSSAHRSTPTSPFPPRLDPTTDPRLTTPSDASAYVPEARACAPGPAPHTERGSRRWRGDACVGNEAEVPRLSVRSIWPSHAAQAGRERHNW